MSTASVICTPVTVLSGQLAFGHHLGVATRIAFFVVICFLVLLAAITAERSDRRGR